MNNYYQTQINTLQSSVPLFTDRYRDIILAYTFLRERIFNNNSLSTYETDSLYGNNLDLKYNDQSTQAEKDILTLLNNHQMIDQNMVDLTLMTESANFCQGIIG